MHRPVRRPERSPEPLLSPGRCGVCGKPLGPKSRSDHTSCKARFRSPDPAVPNLCDRHFQCHICGRFCGNYYSLTEHVTGCRAMNPPAPAGNAPGGPSNPPGPPGDAPSGASHSIAGVPVQNASGEDILVGIITEALSDTSRPSSPDLAVESASEQLALLSLTSQSPGSFDSNSQPSTSGAPPPETSPGAAPLATTVREDRYLNWWELKHVSQILPTLQSPIPFDQETSTSVLQSASPTSWPERRSSSSSESSSDSEGFATVSNLITDAEYDSWIDASFSNMMNAPSADPNEDAEPADDDALSGSAQNEDAPAPVLTPERQPTEAERKHPILAAHLISAPLYPAPEDATPGDLMHPELTRQLRAPCLLPPPLSPEPSALQPPAQEPPAQEPPAQERSAQESPAQEPPAQEPPAQEPLTQEPPAEEPPAQEPSAQEPSAQEPTAQESAAQESAAQEPLAQEPPAEEPPAQEPPEQDHRCNMCTQVVETNATAIADHFKTCIKINSAPSPSSTPRRAVVPAGAARSPDQAHAFRDEDFHQEMWRPWWAARTKKAPEKLVFTKGRFECHNVGENDCKSQFELHVHYLKHLVVRHEQRIAGHRCVKCREWFPTLSIFIVHILEAHMFRYDFLEVMAKVRAKVEEEERRREESGRQESVQNQKRKRYRHRGINLNRKSRRKQKFADDLKKMAELMMRDAREQERKRKREEQERAYKDSGSGHVFSRRRESERLKAMKKAEKQRKAKEAKTAGEASPDVGRSPGKQRCKEPDNGKVEEADDKSSRREAGEGSTNTPQSPLKRKSAERLSQKRNKKLPRVEEDEHQGEERRPGTSKDRSDNEKSPRKGERYTGLKGGM